MNSQITKLAETEQEDTSRVSTPTASTQLPLPRVASEYPPLSPHIDRHEDQPAALDATDTFAASLAAMLDSSLNLSDNPEPSRPLKPSTPPESNHIQLVLPLPALPTNQSQIPVLHPEPGQEERLVSLEDLPPDIASADISVARESPLFHLILTPFGLILCYALFEADGSFVETSSGAAAREIKRRYDKYLGVGKDVQTRSPYAITAFVNQHGRQMYRVG